jgi:hypothetical protein
MEKPREGSDKGRGTIRFGTGKCLVVRSTMEWKEADESSGTHGRLDRNLEKK